MHFVGSGRQLLNFTCLRPRPITVLNMLMPLAVCGLLTLAVGLVLTIGADAGRPPPQPGAALCQSTSASMAAPRSVLRLLVPSGRVGMLPCLLISGSAAGRYFSMTSYKADCFCRSGRPVRLELETRRGQDGRAGAARGERVRRGLLPPLAAGALLPKTLLERLHRAVVAAVPAHHVACRRQACLTDALAGRAGAHGGDPRRWRRENARSMPMRPLACTIERAAGVSSCMAQWKCCKR